jgi:hypothetical protein
LKKKVKSILRYIAVFQKKVKYSLTHTAAGEFGTGLDMFTKELTLTKMAASIGDANIFETKI